MLARATVVLAIVLTLGACGGGGGGTPPAVPTVVPGTLGGPIPGLSTEEMLAFERGSRVFSRVFRPSEGLGPFYNATSCRSCHSTPVPGGSARLYRNFYIALVGTPPGQTTLPPFLSPVVPAFGTGPLHLSAAFSLTGPRTRLPRDYLGDEVFSAQRNALPLFGVGLFEFVSSAEIGSRADPDDTDGDGISGRYNTDAGSIGRFGVKAQSTDVERFTRAPLQNQMGITSNPLPSATKATARQASQNPDDPTRDADGVPDPEISEGDLSDLITFTRFLAPPAPKPFDDAASRGQALFGTLGCAKCHVPEIQSARGPLAAYTDLLLHDLGPTLADGLSFGVPQASATSPPHTGSEFRTQPLWGVSMHAPFLHDGRAQTLREAILLHGGEAAAIRAAFAALSTAEQDDVIAFLEHL